MELPQTIITGIAANEQIGRIAADGIHKGQRVSVVIEPGEVPKTVKTSDQMQKFLLTRLQQEAEGKK